MRITVIGIVMMACVACSSLPAARRGRVDPRVKLDLISVVRPSTGGVTATLRLTNDSDRPFTYRGYSIEQPSNLSTTEVWHRLRWRSNQMIGCGTGIGNVSLAPGGSVEFPLAMLSSSFHGDKFSRLRVVLHESDGDRVVRSRSFRVPAPDRALQATDAGS